MIHSGMHAHALPSSFYSITTDSRANAPRWHAFRDAPRHKSAPRRTFQCWTQSVQKCIPTRSAGTRMVEIRAPFFGLIPTLKNVTHGPDSFY
ncbi:DUF1534 domain-containing protein [Pseudomonas syringae pv. actinidiae]|nr:DUF1534 domain-containing protein [Pseudomonas syringae pv. actinidiae]